MERKFKIGDKVICCVPTKPISKDSYVRGKEYTVIKLDEIIGPPPKDLKYKYRINTIDSKGNKNGWGEINFVISTKASRVLYGND